MSGSKMLDAISTEIYDVRVVEVRVVHHLPVVHHAPHEGGANLVCIDFVAHQGTARSGALRAVQQRSRRPCFRQDNDFHVPPARSPMAASAHIDARLGENGHPVEKTVMTSGSPTGITHRRSPADSA